MAQDRPGGTPTEEPTPRRLAEARRRGEVARSVELTSAVSFAAGVGVLAAAGGRLSGEIASRFRAGLERATAGQLDAGAALVGCVADLAWLTLPVLAVATLAAAAAGFLQIGGLFTLRPLAPSGARLDPVAGLGRMFSRRAAGESLKALAKLLVIGAVAWLTLAPRLPDLARLPSARPSAALAWTVRAASALVLRVAVAYVLLGVVDLVFARRRHLRELRMTREEVRRELKESEGDPRHKAERQRLHRELLRHQMIESVRGASCVIVNPTHRAVALRYDAGAMGAPQVVAKGERLVAAQIREIARAYGVPIVRDVPLARALCELELGDEIPAELYDAVAEVLRLLGQGADGELST